ncbi:MAG TPA: hypothetical protein VMV17_18055 [Streptosporangiaceae bacterium]|nr:hypothetical protein [Streptosporangiaceae bacterium]
MSLEDLLPWGYTWQTLERLARRAAAASPARIFDPGERREVAMDGIVMALAEAVSPPSERELTGAGMAAISAESADYISRHGIGLAGANRGTGFAVYWGPGNHPHRDPMAGVDERVALAQVWEQMTRQDRETISVLAYWLDHRAAARALGHTWTGWKTRIMRARIRVKTLWFAPEPPPVTTCTTAGRLRAHPASTATASTVAARAGRQHHD